MYIDYATMSSGREAHVKMYKAALDVDYPEKHRKAESGAIVCRWSVSGHETNLTIWRLARAVCTGKVMKFIQDENTYALLMVFL